MPDSSGAMHRIKSVTEKGKGALIHLEDGSKPVWTPDYGVAVALIGKPIPSDWVRKEGEYGPQAFPPKSGKGGGGYRNTKEAFEAEAKSRREWQLVEEDRRDRRTALMQAVTLASAFIGGDPEPKTGLRPGQVVIESAETFYDWLKDHETSVSVLGKGGAEETGTGGADEGTSLPASTSPGFPVDQQACAERDHKDNRGKTRFTTDTNGATRCNLCGMSWIAAVEGTTADLGSA